MTSHLTNRIIELKNQLQFSEEIKEEAAYRILILREPIQEVIEQLGIPNVYVIIRKLKLYIVFFFGQGYIKVVFGYVYSNILFDSFHNFVIEL